ncbi:hypothetical protein [Streptomyces sp. NPDC059371]|uniref:hypothetical protein n=1 Tax=Streptomyces sp. NPDC059371 TaxID=3346812 RepID=UPI00369044E6
MTESAMFDYWEKMSYPWERGKMGLLLPYFVDDADKARTREQQVKFITEVRDEAKAEYSKWKKTEKRWLKAHYIFGLPPVALSAIAGLTAFYSTAGRIPAAILACTAAVTGAISAFLNCEKYRSDAERRVGAWQVLEMEAKMALANPQGDMKEKLLGMRDLYVEIRFKGGQEGIYEKMMKVKQ